MLVGRTFSYSDTQRYRVGPNYLQLPVNPPLERPATNQRDGQMTYVVDASGENPHVNYEPSSLGGLSEAARSGADHEPEVRGRLMRRKLARTNDYAQAGDRFRTMADWERDDLVTNMIDLLGQCEQQIQERMIDHFAKCDPEYGRRVAEGLGLPVTDAAEAIAAG
jgi:catalase